MSLIRVNPPGKPVTFIDLGPDSPAQSRSGSFGGPIVPVPRLKPAKGVTLPDPYPAKIPKYVEPPPKAPRPKCGRPLPIAGGTCARMPGHTPSCRNVEQMARHNELRAARRSA